MSSQHRSVLATMDTKTGCHKDRNTTTNAHVNTQLPVRHALHMFVCTIQLLKRKGRGVMCKKDRKFDIPSGEEGRNVGER